MTESNQDHPSTIPRFANEAEMGDFWDTHSPEDFPDEFEDVEAAISPRLLTRVLTIKLSYEMIEQLRKAARDQGIGPSTPARIWILERLRDSAKKPA